MTYVEVYALSRVHLLKAVEHFPVARRLVRRAIFVVALRREVIKRASHARKANEDVIDSIMAASTHSGGHTATNKVTACHGKSRHPRNPSGE